MRVVAFGEALVYEEVVVCLSCGVWALWGIGVAVCGSLDVWCMAGVESQY